MVVDLGPAKVDVCGGVRGDGVSAEGEGGDHGWAAETARHREVLESELLTVRPMRYSGRGEVFERIGGRAEVLSEPELAPLRLGRLTRIAIGVVTGRRLER
jgi:hypothetical protein